MSKPPMTPSPFRISIRRMNKPNSLYVHIPFCEGICAYCDFTKVLFNKKWAFSYVEELEKELKSKEIGLVDTIYVGGGTPTCLPIELLDKVLSMLQPHLSEGGEFSIESNPENLSIEKCSLLVSKGVNRLSIGVQSTKSKFLSSMGRKHNLDQVKKAISNAKKASISNINLDMIYGLPTETVEDAIKDAKILSSLGVEHLSAYSLTIGNGTLFHQQGFHEASQEDNASQYEAIMDVFEKAGYKRYEVSNFAKEGFECRHNLTYWKDNRYYAIGLGASGYEEDIRYKNTSNLSKYLQGQWLSEEEKVKKNDDIHYYLLCNLRLVEGFLLKDFEDRFGYSFLEAKLETINKLKGQGLLEANPRSIRCSERGLYLLDRILVDLF